MKQLISFFTLLLFTSISIYSQNHLHAINAGGGEVAKLESLTGFPQLVLANNHGNIARIGLSQTVNTNAINDDDLLLKGMKPFSKIKFEVGDNTGTGLVTINPTNDVNNAIVGALVGINTQSPSSPLTVTSIQGGVTAEFRTGASETFAIWTAVDGTLKQKGYAGFFDDQNNAIIKNNFRIGTPALNPQGALDFRTQNINRMTIKNTGQVFIGDVSSFPSALLSSPERLNICGNVQASGSFTANAFSCASDVRFKTDIVRLENPIQKLQQLNGVSYQWKTDTFTKRGFTEDKQIGLIAQEVEAVLPELVATGNDGYKSVDYQSLSAVLVEAIKTQQETIEKLEQRISNLEAGKK